MLQGMSDLELLSGMFAETLQDEGYYLMATRATIGIGLAMKPAIRPTYKGRVTMAIATIRVGLL